MYVPLNVFISSKGSKIYILLYSNFQAFSILLCFYSSVCVGPVQNVISNGYKVCIVHVFVMELKIYFKLLHLLALVNDGGVFC